VLRLVYESPGGHLLDMPDNLCVSPRGGLVLCEDGTANPSIHGLSTDGRIFRLARNNILLAGETRGITGDFRDGEFAGATFSPDGQWLFVNAQSPGVTFAITGPWGKGLL
jgi:secreted PhoX family phosphatase